MSMRKRKDQTPQNPFIKSDSQYACAVPDCPDHGVWSPMINGSVWYCRFHAGLPELRPRVRLSADETLALMARIWSPTRQVELKRAAIQAEGQ